MNNFVKYHSKTGLELINFTKKHGAARAMLDFLTRHMKSNNGVMISNQALSEVLGMSISSTNKNIRILKDNNLLVTIRTGHSSIFYINAAVATCTKERYVRAYTLNTTVILSDKEARHQADLFANREELFHTEAF